MALSGGEENDAAVRSRIEAATRVVRLVEANSSPDVPDVLLFQILAIAAGIAFANATYPAAAEAELKCAGALFATGVQAGMAQRTAAEKESCHGTA